MKKRLMLLLFALLSGWSAMAYSFEVDGIYYRQRSGTSNEVEVTSYLYGYYSGTVVIPATVRDIGTTYISTYTVTAIVASAC